MDKIKVNYLYIELYWLKSNCINNLFNLNILSKT